MRSSQHSCSRAEATSFPEQRGQDRLDVRLSAPKRMVAFPNDDICVETVRELDVCACVLPRLPLRDVADDDPDLLVLRKKRFGDDLACIS